MKKVYVGEGPKKEALTLHADHGFPEKCIERFWGKVSVSSSCWEWTAGLFKRGGYGQFNAFGAESTPQKTHRMSFQFVNGRIDSSVMVCHHCDNPKCVRPDHLYAGNAVSNNKDARIRGRAYLIPVTRGEICPAAKLTNEQVPVIRSLYSSGATMKEIGERFGVTKQAIWRLLHGRSWKSV